MMLKIVVPANPGTEQWDDEKQEFVYFNPTKEQTLELEHSLVSISKWESKWCKPFLNTDKLTSEENIDYVRCMSLSRNIDSNIYANLTSDNLLDIKTYISSPMTATVITDARNARKTKQEVLTSELIYYYMIADGIPFECEKWHLNRLLTLIKICNIKSDTGKKKMPKNEILRNNAALNAARRNKIGTTG